jgi:predicted Rossmann fold flavoprotein
MDTSMYDVLVIGGGASGMMAAGRAAELGKRVLLLDKNYHLGEKLKITGGGRCNITNAQEDRHLLLAHYGAAEPHLQSPFSQFGVRETFTFFEDRGLPLVVQAHLRVFPKTERAVDVCAVMERYVRDNGVEVRSPVTVEKILSSDSEITGVVAAGVTWTAKSYILATGGKSHPETGSTGDGFSWLAEIGHTVHEPLPSIVPLASSTEWVKQLAGVTLPDVRVSFYVDGKKQFMVSGSVLCTHFGLSGPIILNSATRVADVLHQGSVTASIDLYPKLDIGALDRHLRSVFDQQKNKTLKNVLKYVVPAGTATVIASLLNDVDLETKTHSITKEQRRHIAQLLKALSVGISGLMGHDRAVITDGGVALSEIDTRYMRSRKFNNLYVTGDMLHISRPSGGYSLQLCWTTGYVAGTYAGV